MKNLRLGICACNSQIKGHYDNTQIRIYGHLLVVREVIIPPSSVRDTVIQSECNLFLDGHPTRARGGRTRYETSISLSVVSMGVRAGEHGPHEWDYRLPKFPWRLRSEGEEDWRYLYSKESTGDSYVRPSTVLRWIDRLFYRIPRAERYQLIANL